MSSAGLFLLAFDYLLFRSGLGASIMRNLNDFNPLNILMLVMYSLLPFAGSLLIVIGLMIAVKNVPSK